MTATTTEISPAEYLASERVAERKSEYIDGERIEMAGASIEHDRIVGDIFGEVRQALRPSSCEVFTADVRVQLTEARYVYPDLTVVYGEPLFADAEVDTLTNPSVVFEILSASTENYDLGDKSRLYRQRDTLSSLVLVAQDRPWVEVWTRESAGGWLVREFTGLDAVADLPALKLTLPLTEIYRRIEFPV
jgi:Uma2 family endonuclease